MQQGAPYQIEIARAVFDSAIKLLIALSTISHGIERSELLLEMRRLPDTKVTEKREMTVRNYTRSHRRRYEPIIDGLPEQMHYVDTGCEVAMSCLACPLPRCKFDDPAWYQAYRRQGRDIEVLDACRTEGLSVTLQGKPEDCA
jgi:hypothetical protein